MEILLNRTHCVDCLDGLAWIPDDCVDCVITSPPYFNLRDYDAAGQIGLEETPEEYISRLADVFDEVRRVLKPSGTLWLNIGDSYAGSMKGAAKFPDNAMNYKQGTNRGLLGKATVVKKLGGDYKPKDLIGIPWMLAFELRRRGWYLRQDIIWQKPNPMPESVTDRCTRSHEYIFLFSKKRKYYFKQMLEPAKYDGRTDTRIKGSHKYSQGVTGLTPQTFAARGMNRWPKSEDGTFLRNVRDVWNIPISHNTLNHFATFPEQLATRILLAACPEGGTVLEPFMGSGTTAVVAARNRRQFIGFDISREYVDIANERVEKEFDK